MASERISLAVTVIAVLVTATSCFQTKAASGEPTRDQTEGTTPLQPFEDVVEGYAYGKMEPVPLIVSEFRAAVATYVKSTDNDANTSAAELQDLSDFTFQEGWQGSLSEDRRFRLDIYEGRERPFGLVVRTFVDDGGDPLDKEVTFTARGHLQGFVFYDTHVRFITGRIGALGPAYNIESGAFVEPPNDQEFEKLRQALIAFQRQQDRSIDPTKDYTMADYTVHLADRNAVSIEEEEAE